MNEGFRAAQSRASVSLAEVQIQLLTTAKTKGRARRLLAKHHYPAPPGELIVLDGKEPRQGGGHSVLTAVTVPSPHYLGNAIVDTKTNEIPGARRLFKKLGRDGRKVSLDALHTQTQTARQLVLEPGADFLLTVKDHQPTLRANIEKPVTAPPAGFSPSLDHPDAGRKA